MKIVFSFFFPVCAFSILSHSYHSKSNILPSFFSSCFDPFSRIASYLHIQVLLCSHSYPSLLLSSFLLPDTGRLSLAHTAHGWYCLENKYEIRVMAAVRILSPPMTQNELIVPLFTKKYIIALMNQGLFHNNSTEHITQHIRSCIKERELHPRNDLDEFLFSDNVSGTMRIGAFLIVANSLLILSTFLFFVALLLFLCCILMVLASYKDQMFNTILLKGEILDVPSYRPSLYLPFTSFLTFPIFFIILLPFSFLSSMVKHSSCSLKVLQKGLLKL